MLLNFAYEIRKVVNRVLAKILYCIEAEHAVTLELRFGEKLVSRALVRKCFAPCKIFVDVARFIAESYWALRTSKQCAAHGGQLQPVFKFTSYMDATNRAPSAPLPLLMGVVLRSCVARAQPHRGRLGFQLGCDRIQLGIQTLASQRVLLQWALWRFQGAVNGPAIHHRGQDCAEITRATKSELGQPNENEACSSGDASKAAAATETLRSKINRRAGCTP